MVEEDETILGYAYATDWKPRGAYRHSVESTVYLRDGHSGNGFGTQLYTALLDELKNMDVHAIIGGIGLPNDGSIALHKNLALKKWLILRKLDTNLING